MDDSGAAKGLGEGKPARTLILMLRDGVEQMGEEKIDRKIDRLRSARCLWRRLPPNVGRAPPDDSLCANSRGSQFPPGFPIARDSDVAKAVSSEPSGLRTSLRNTENGTLVKTRREFTHRTRPSSSKARVKAGRDDSNSRRILSAGFLCIADRYCGCG